LEGAKQPRGRVAAGIPALEECGFVGIQQTAAAVTPPLAPRKGGSLEIALHGALTHPDMSCNGGDSPALAVQDPDLRIRALPARLALGRALLGRRGRLCRWHGHCDRTFGHRHRLLAQRRIDRIENLAMAGEHLVQRFCQVLEQMKTVGDLDRRGCSLVSAIGVSFRAITRDHLHPRMLPEPLGQGLGGTIREEGDRLAALQINQDRKDVAWTAPIGQKNFRTLSCNTTR
jgi:hypothetical protein